MRWVGPEGYWVSDDPTLIDVEWLHDWLNRESFWARGRPLEVVRRSIEHSMVFGLYSREGRQVGFARFVTDRATFGWLCDVFVESPAQGRGLGTFLVETALSHPDVKDIRLVLSADPGRSLYQRQGFTALAKPERLMERRPKPAAR